MHSANRRGPHHHHCKSPKQDSSFSGVTHNYAHAGFRIYSVLLRDDVGLARVKQARQMGTVGSETGTRQPGHWPLYIYVLHISRPCEPWRTKAYLGRRDPDIVSGQACSRDAGELGGSWEGEGGGPGSIIVQ